LAAAPRGRTRWIAQAEAEAEAVAVDNARIQATWMANLPPERVNTATGPPPSTFYFHFPCAAPSSKLHAPSSSLLLHGDNDNVWLNKFSFMTLETRQRAVKCQLRMAVDVERGHGCGWCLLLLLLLQSR